MRKIASLKGQMHEGKCVAFKGVQGVKFWGIEHKVEWVQPNQAGEDETGQWTALAMVC